MTNYEAEETPEVSFEEEGDDKYGKIVAEPLPAGFGTTLGNALRRTLLSSLPGVAITSVHIEGIEHEFSTIPNMKEDVVEFLLNVKDIRVRALTDRPGKMFLEASGEGEVKASQIDATADFEVVNADQHLATLESKKGRLSVEFTVEHGSGYVPAGSTEGLAIGVIPVDAIYSPVRRVSYHVEHTRVGQVTNFDRLSLEVWTDGITSPMEAVSNAAEVLADQFALFSRMGRPAEAVVTRGLGTGSALTSDRYNTPIEDLALGMRAYNCLKRSGLMTVGAVLEKSEEELLALRNFGRKSYDELKDKLIGLGFLPEGGVAEEDVSLPLHQAAAGRTVAAAPSASGDEELGPVAKALLEALKESGNEELLGADEENEE